MTRTAGCQCEAGIRDYGPLLLERLARINESLQKRSLNPPGQSLDELAQGRRREFVHSRLEPMQDVDPHSPFMMVQVDDDVIGGHSDIFNQRIVDFMLEFFLLAEAKRAVIEATR
jgi:hypothetical protein